jgi:transcriptional regulator with XRE-family HTH domain
MATKFNPESIRKIRTDKGLSRTKTASAVNVGYITLQQWETGKAAPRAIYLGPLADVLGVTPDAFYSRDEASG